MSKVEFFEIVMRIYQLLSDDDSIIISRFVLLRECGVVAMYSTSSGSSRVIKMFHCGSEEASPLIINFQCFGV